MGCSESTTALPAEEALIQETEESIGLCNLPTIQILMVVKKFAQTPEITHKTIQAVLIELGFGRKYYSSSSIYSYLIPEEDFMCSANKLKILGILLGRGTKKEKAKLLSIVADSLCSKKNNKNAISELLEEIFTIAFDYIPSYTIDQITNDEEKKFCLMRYRERLLSSSKSLKNYYEILLTRHSQECFDTKHLAEIIEHTECSALISPTELRLKGIEIYTHNVASEKLVKAFVMLDPYIYELP